LFAGACALRLSPGAFLASCSFKRARTVDAALAAAAVLVALLTFFDAATFRRTTATGLFAAPARWVVALTLELVRFRFESLVAALFILARLVLLVLLDLRAPRAVVDAGLLLLARFRTLDEEERLSVLFDLGFALEAAPVFFAFELVVFFDLLRATIVNLSTRILSRTRYNSVHAHCSRSVHEYSLLERQVDFSSRETTCVFARDARRLPLDD
jgi:hypothetical protein